MVRIKRLARSVRLYRRRMKSGDWAKHNVKVMAYHMSRQVYLEAQLHGMLAFTKTFSEKNGEINRAVKLPPDSDLESLDGQA